MLVTAAHKGKMRLLRRQDKQPSKVLAFSTILVAMFMLEVTDAACQEVCEAPCLQVWPA